MKTTESTERVAQAAAVWNENEKHKQVMKLLDGVYGHVAVRQEINGNYYYWEVFRLPEAQALEIVKRGRHDEIMYMIHRYGQTACPPEQRSTCHLWGDGRAILPESVQELIALRDNWEEINAYLSYQGFDKRGQDVILDRGNHYEIMGYIQRHGFQPVQQRKLKNRNNKDEFLLHIARHGLCDELIDELFDRLENGGSTDEYYDFITRHELPVNFQKRMLKIVKEPEFKAYVDRYGLWEDVHSDLLDYRSDQELFYYFLKHPYLEQNAETKLAKRNVHSLNVLYAEKRPETRFSKINHFWNELLHVQPLDYEALATCFLRLDYTPERWKVSSPDCSDEDADVQLMKDGSHEEVMARIHQGQLSKKALATLFFRNNPEEFEAYVHKWIH